MTSLQRPTTCPTYWRHVTVCYTHCGSCAVMASQSLRYIDVFRATVIAKLTYCAPSWSGACSAADRAKLESFVSRCKRLACCSSEVPTYTDLTDEADDTLFSRIMSNQGHVLQSLPPDRQSIPYSLRERSHNKTLLNKSTHLNNDDFLIQRFVY